MVEAAQYCNSGNFRENFIFANSDIKHICDAKNSRLVHDFPISDFAISRGFDFHETSHMRSFAKIKPSRKFTNLQYITVFAQNYNYPLKIVLP